MRDDSGFYSECLVGGGIEELGNTGEGASSTMEAMCSILQTY